MLKRIISLSAVTTVLVLFLGFTDPESMPIGLLFIPVILLFIIASLLVNLCLKLFLKKISPSKEKLLSVTIGAISSISFLFYSSGGVVFGDFILIVLILLVSLIYINKY